MLYIITIISIIIIIMIAIIMFMFIRGVAILRAKYYTADLTKMTIRRRMLPKVHWTVLVTIHWTSETQGEAAPCARPPATYVADFRLFRR